MKKYITTSLLVLSLAVMGQGCFGGGSTPSDSSPGSTASQAELDAASERFQKANVEVLNLMTEASQAGHEIAQYQSRQATATRKTLTNFPAAADEMESVANDLRTLLGR